MRVLNSDRCLLLIMFAFVLLIGFFIMGVSNLFAHQNPYGEFKSVEESCPTLHKLGLQGTMQVQEGLMFLENKLKKMEVKEA